MESNTALGKHGIGTGRHRRHWRRSGTATARRGWTVRALRRGGEQQTERRDGIVWVRGDAMNRDDVLAAAQGCAVIVHAVNPPGYRRWGELVLPMLDNTIAAAQAQGATIVLPGTVYNFGPSAFPTLREDSPQEPVTRKGAIRAQMEQHLQAASSQGCKVIVVRAGDFFGPKLGNSWFSQGMLKPGQPVKAISVPNAPGVGHQWSYLPDVARNHGGTGAAQRNTGTLRRLPHGRPLGRRRHPAGRSHQPRCRQARRHSAQGQRLPLVAHGTGRTLCAHAAGDAGDALSVDHAGGDEQREAGRNAGA